ncbi:hypothetical protein Q3G72_033599 [Acer saccharum]|nr:hypothetical protein Q3G72_033599 [Acer saccharum]
MPTYDQSVKVVDIVDTFRLQEQPPFDKKQFVGFIKKLIKSLTPKLDAEQQEIFKKNIEGATKFLLSKLSDLQLTFGSPLKIDEKNFHINEPRIIKWEKRWNC